MNKLLVCFLLLVFLAVSVVAQAVWKPNTPPVTEVTVGTTRYLGGPFTQMGVEIGSSGMFDPLTAKVDLRFPKISGKTFAIVPDGQGGWLVGGDFGLAHVLPDMTRDKNFDFFVNGTVRAIAVRDGEVFFGGSFTEVNGFHRERLGSARLIDGVLSGFAPVLARDPNDGQAPIVLALAVSRDGSLAVAGSFAAVNGEARQGFVQFNADGVLTGLTIHVADQYDVTGLLTCGDDLYVGVRTREGGSVFAGVLLKLSLQTQKVLWSVETETSASTLTCYRGALYSNVSRLMQSDTGVRVVYGTAFNSQTGAVLNWTPRVDGTILGMTAHAGVVYLAGYFSSYAAAVTAYDGSLTPWNPGVTGWARCVGVVNGKVVVGGYFDSAAGKIREGFAAIDLRTGELLDFDPKLNGSVTLLLTDGSQVFAFGGFNRWNGTLARAVSFNALSQERELLKVLPGTLGTIHCGVVANGTVYIGGDFVNYVFRAPDGTTYSRANLAAFDAASGEMLNYFQPQADNVVYDMSLDSGNTTLFILGDFQRINGVLLSPSGWARLSFTGALLN